MINYEHNVGFDVVSLFNNVPLNDTIQKTVIKIPKNNTPKNLIDMMKSAI